MNSTQIFIVQVAMNMLTYTLIALWYVAPRLARLPRERALPPLLFFHLFRTIGLMFLIPGVVGARIPGALAGPAAYGDLLALALAFIALLAVRGGWRVALALVWIFNIEGTLDLLNAYFQGRTVLIGHLSSSYSLGSAWYIPTFIVPALLVTHGLIFWLLLRPQRAASNSALVIQPDEAEAQAVTR